MRAPRLRQPVRSARTLLGMESADMRQNGHLAGKNAAGVTEMTSSVDWRLTGELSAAAGKVASLLKAAAPLGVAFSGGVDSSVLLALAVRVLGADHVVAILGVSPSLGSDERLAAHQVAAFIGARLIEVQTREADNPAYRANEPDRCFTARGTQYGACSSQGFWGDRDAREVSLAGLRLRTTDRFTYEYAFFSNLQTWRHDVRVQAIEPARPWPRYAWCGGGARSAPPEECGGPFAFMALRQEHSRWQTTVRMAELVHLLVEAAETRPA